MNLSVKQNFNTPNYQNQNIHFTSKCGKPVRRISTIGDIRLNKTKNPLSRFNSNSKPNPLLNWLKGIKISIRETIKDFQ